MSVYTPAGAGPSVEAVCAFAHDLFERFCPHRLRPKVDLAEVGSTEIDVGGLFRIYPTAVPPGVPGWGIVRIPDDGLDEILAEDQSHVLICVTALLGWIESEVEEHLSQPAPANGQG